MLYMDDILEISNDVKLIIVYVVAQVTKPQHFVFNHKVYHHFVYFIINIYLAISAIYVHHFSD